MRLQVSDLGVYLDRGDEVLHFPPAEWIAFVALVEQWGRDSGGKLPKAWKFPDDRGYVFRSILPGLPGGSA
jgi:hypothetical protein